MHGSHELVPSVRVVLGPYATEPLPSRSVGDAGEPALLGPGPTNSFPRFNEVSFCALSPPLVRIYAMACSKCHVMCVDAQPVILLVDSTSRCLLGIISQLKSQCLQETSKKIRISMDITGYHF